jgi:hypothetical protein
LSCVVVTSAGIRSFARQPKDKQRRRLALLALLVLLVLLVLLPPLALQ